MNSDIGDSSEFTHIAIFSFMCQKCVIFHIFDICFVKNTHFPHIIPTCYVLSPVCHFLQIYPLAVSRHFEDGYSAVHIDRHYHGFLGGNSRVCHETL